MNNYGNGNDNSQLTLSSIIIIKWLFYCGIFDHFSNWRKGEEMI